MDIGPSELVIIVIILLLLFGGSRLAGLGKSAGRALKEFKEETQGHPADDRAVTSASPAPALTAPTNSRHRRANIQLSSPTQ